MKSIRHGKTANTFEKDLSVGLNCVAEELSGSFEVSFTGDFTSFLEDARLLCLYRYLLLLLFTYVSRIVE